MQLRNKTPKRRVKAKLRDDRKEAVGPNDVWAMDFVHDQLATGKKIRVLTVVDTFSRYVPVLDPRFSYRAEDVVRSLEQVCPMIGYPKTIRRRPRLRVRLPRPRRPMGLCERRYARLQQAGKADRQRIHRSLQWSLQGGMPERPLVRDPCRHAAEKSEDWRSSRCLMGHESEHLFKCLNRALATASWFFDSAGSIVALISAQYLPGKTREWKNCFWPYLYLGQKRDEADVDEPKEFCRIASRCGRNVRNFFTSVCIALQPSAAEHQPETQLKSQRFASVQISTWGGHGVCYSTS